MKLDFFNNQKRGRNIFKSATIIQHWGVEYNQFIFDDFGCFFNFDCFFLYFKQKDKSCPG